MKSESSIIKDELLNFATKLSTQIKTHARHGLTDLAKSQETSLLPLINRAYGTNFINLNNVKKNFPCFDYGSEDEKTGLQMTATVSKQKFQGTLKIYDKYESLQEEYPNIIFFLLTVDRVNSSTLVNRPNVTYITLDDMISEVIKKDREFQESFLDLAKKEYRQYFTNYSNQENDFSPFTPPPVPKDLMLFNESISTKKWFPSNPDEGYLGVHIFITEFQSRLSRCSKKAREILISIIKIATKPKYPMEEITIDVNAVFGNLNIDENNLTFFDYHFRFLLTNKLLYIRQYDFNINNDDNGPSFTCKNEYLLGYEIYEPNINLFSAILLFYLNRHCMSDFENAILTCDFSKLSDSSCRGPNDMPSFHDQ